METHEVYQLLEEKMLSYTDYADVPVKDNDEPLVAIPETAHLQARQIGTDMQPFTGEQVYVRQAVLCRLGQAAAALAERNNQLALEVVYGYRAPHIQQKLFEQAKAKLAGKYEGEALLAATHRIIAVPWLAGHPAGAAVDIQITQNCQPLDFGTKIWEFAPDSFTFSPFISRKAWANRQLLREVMLTSGFAPFDGEWWHFSYGDKEWARYYGKKFAQYDLARPAVR